MSPLSLEHTTCCNPWDYILHVGNDIGERRISYALELARSAVIDTSLTSCVTLNTLPNLPEAQFSHL